MRNALPTRKRSAIAAENVKVVLSTTRTGRSNDAGGGSDPSDQLFCCRLACPFHSRIPAEAVNPPVAEAGREERAGRRRIGDIDPVPVPADDVPQRRPDDRREGVHDVIDRGHPDAQALPDDAVRAVGPDDIPGQDGAADSRVASAKPKFVASRSRSYVLDGDSEFDPRGRKALQVLEQDRLKVVLRCSGRPGRTELSTLDCRRVADVDQRARGRLGQCRRQQHPPFDVVTAGPNLVLEAPGAEQLHRSEADYGRARVGEDSGRTVHDQGLDPGAGEGDRGDQPGGTRSHNGHRPAVGLTNWQGRHQLKRQDRHGYSSFD